MRHGAVYAGALRNTCRCGFAPSPRTYQEVRLDEVCKLRNSHQIASRGKDRNQQISKTYSMEQMSSHSFIQSHDE
ncbi:hypothetical protein KIN20_034364 [Parelaphostrongylus tenuis]|uniref:Uncharacterized protein n=1 Tax=Parelaphostrongylus tenuis TaxID=148309 RepID=A0AAD5RA83_PARTN|nr:hypothetical protein KIN20_034364 [Parelaphostrongylus tenuis]